jgi:uncharacterized protein
LKINIKDLSDDWIQRKWDEPVVPVNGILNREPHNTLRFEEPLSVIARIALIVDDIDIHGSVDGQISFECDRCCEVSGKSVKEDFHYILMPKPDSGVTANENPDEDEAPELSYYEGDEIDISALVLEQLVLSIPLKRLCEENCKGVCTGCGANLNAEKCQCREDPAVNITSKKNKQRQKEF